MKNALIGIVSIALALAIYIGGWMILMRPRIVYGAPFHGHMALYLVKDTDSMTDQILFFIYSPMIQFLHLKTFG